MECSTVIEKIKQENEWRQTDFANIKILYKKIPKENQALFLRMTIPYLYAHWEGFVVDSLKKIVEYFNKLALKHENVKINVFVLSINDRFNYLKGKQSFAQKCEFSETFLGSLQNKLKFDKKNINTKSNLNFNVLLELCEIFGFAKGRFEKYANDLNRFVNIRNSIAHGENSYVISIDNFENYVELVNNLIDDLQIEIEEYLSEEKYLKV